MAIAAGLLGDRNAWSSLKPLPVDGSHHVDGGRSGLLHE
jgi:hypothetical protein